MTYNATLTVGSVSQAVALEIDMRLMSAQQYNDPPSDAAPLSVMVRDDQNRLIAGLTGKTSYGWFLIKSLWVAEAFREAGLGTQILSAAEGEALARGCHHARLDTSSAKAEQFYLRHGYAVFGVLENGEDETPVGHRRAFMSKPLRVDPLSDGLLS